MSENRRDLHDPDTCGKCGREMSAIQRDGEWAPAGTCPEHGIMYVHPNHYESHEAGDVAENEGAI